MALQKADLIVIGAGPGGYVAAIRAAQLGLNVMCVDKQAGLGGTCLNVGCIPSKALLHSSHLYEIAQHDFARHGVIVKKLELDLKKMIANKDTVVKELNQGIDYLFKKNKVTRVLGSATFKSANEVTITKDDGSTEEWLGKDIIIATGSKVATLPGIEIDETDVVSSTGALSLKKVPKSMIVVGGGYIGLEMGSVWLRLCTEVTVVEFMDRIVPAMDKDIISQLQKILEKQGLKFKLSTKVTKVDKKKGKLAVTLESADGGKSETLEVETLLMSVGRRPNTDGLNLEKIGVAKDNRGFIHVNEKFETSVSGIYAIGDVIPGPMLAHVAEEEGIAAVENLTGQYGHVNYDAIPGVIYTNPEVASVGKTQAELKEDGIPYNIGKFPFAANSRGKAIGETDGLVKILAHKETDKVLGVHIIGPEAGTLIAEMVTVMEFGGSAEDVARTCHAHPTLNEAIKEAALDVAGRAIHM
jgi:dihydrolipoamide dehydrogenase